MAINKIIFCQKYISAMSLAKIVKSQIYAAVPSSWVYDKLHFVLIFNTKARRHEDTKFSFILCDLCAFAVKKTQGRKDCTQGTQRFVVFLMQFVIHPSSFHFTNISSSKSLRDLRGQVFLL